MRIFKRIGVPCSCKPEVGIEYTPPKGWKLVSGRRLHCGWWTLLLEKTKK